MIYEKKIVIMIYIYVGYLNNLKIKEYLFEILFV